MLNKNNTLAFVWILLISTSMFSLVNSVCSENCTDVDIEQLYDEAEWSLNDGDEYNVSGIDSGGEANLSYETGFDNIGGRVFLLQEGVYINVERERMEAFENNCPFNDSECSTPLNYTFAMWLSLKPYSLNDTQNDAPCRPVRGPILLSVDGFDRDADVYAQTTQSKWVKKRSERSTILMKDFMWNHFAYVVTDGDASIYCNGFPCNEVEVPLQPAFLNRDRTREDIILNKVVEATPPVPTTAPVTTTNAPAATEIPTRKRREAPVGVTYRMGCKQVAYERVTLWDRVLTPSEIQALRFKPFIFTNATTPVPTTIRPRMTRDPRTKPPPPPTTTTQKATPKGPTTEIKIVLPTGSADQQLDFLFDQFNSNSTDIVISDGAISAGVGAFLGVIGGFGPPDVDEDKSYSFSSGFEEVDEEEVSLAIGVGGDLLAKMAAAGLSIPAGDSSSQTRFDMLEFLDSLVDLDVKTGGKDATNLDGSSLLISLEQFMDSFFRERRVPFINARDQFSHIHLYEQSGLDRYMTPVYLTFTEDGNPSNADVNMVVPAEAYEDHRYVRMITAATYDGIHLSMPQKISRAKVPGGNVQTENVEIVSPIMSVIMNFNTTLLKDNISFLYRHREKRRGEETICAYLKFDPETTWETKGCFEGSVNNSFSFCFCNHLTNFALLMATDGLILNDWHSAIATYLTYGVLSISVLCLLATLIILMIYRKALKTKRMRVLRHTALAMFLAHLLFLLGDLALENDTACTIVAALLHYLFLSVFCWMFIMGFQLYTKVRRAHKTRVDFLFYIIFGWGTPVGITGLGVASNTDGYGAPGAACWLNPKDNTIYFFIGPAMGILFFNSLVMILVMRASVKAKKYKDATTVSRMRAAARGVIVMLPIFGLTWGFGLVVQYSLAFVYLFIVLNGLQGLFLFIFHVLLNDEVQDAIKGKQRVKDSGGLSAVVTNCDTGENEEDKSDLIKEDKL